MQNEGNGMGKGLFIGMLTGVAVGSIIAFFYAPKSGKELREDIKTKSQDFIEDADQYVVNAKDKALHLLNDGKKKSKRWLQRLKKKLTLFLK
ncbi:MAG: YtxH domain-containing protein [Ignavibacteriales bacterium]|nr:YtxH domain-containing protein [Ignavibacteriales bacterium]